MFDFLKSQFSKVLSIIRLKPFDCSTPEGRSKERYRRSALSSLSSGVARGISILTALVTVPLTVTYLGSERYGMWVTASSVITLLGFADLGLGNGLLNAISKSDGKDNRKMAHTYISSAFFMLSAIAVFILCLFATVYFFVPWPRIFNVTSDLAVREAGPLIALFILIMTINLPFGIAQRVQIGYQQGYFNHLWSSLGSLLGLGGVLLAIHFKAGLPWLVLAMSGGPTFALLLNWYVLFCWAQRSLFPRWIAFDWAAGRELAGVGVLFFILQAMSLVGNFSDNLVIAQVIGASSVSVYAITQKLFMVTMIAPYFITPLWPAFGEALAREDYAWAKKTLIRILKLSFIMCAITALPLFLFGKQIIVFWVGPEFIPPTSLIVGFSSFVFLSSYIGVMSTFLNNGVLIKKQVVFFSAASLLSLVLKIIFTYKWGIAGPIWGTILGYGLFYVIPAARLAYNFLLSKSNPLLFEKPLS